ncbi:undecaprenyldiphospho-muramoylpentapeptide beta-N-acetylglucosaminyltransferase [Rickettsiales bacterium LUAb2]
MSHSKIIICSGGTGGHLFPAKALAYYLAENYKLPVTFLTDKRASEYINNWHSRILVKSILALPVSGKSLWLKLKAMLYLLLGIYQTILYFAKNKPQVIVCFGGYVSIPPIIAAILLRIPIVLHEQNAMPGRTNRLFARFASKIATSFTNTLHLDKYKSKIIYTGLPVREEFIKFRELNKANLPKAFYNVLILGGSQGASVFGELIPQSFGMLPINIQSKLVVYHQCRKELLNSVKELWRKTKVNVKLNTFFSNIAEIMVNSDLIISRSGASSVSEINCIGRAALYVPYRYATDNHQEYNARAMQEKDAAIVILEKDLTINKLNEMILSLFNNNKFSYQAKCAKLQYNKNSTKNLAEVVTSYLR